MAKATASAAPKKNLPVSIAEELARELAENAERTSKATGNKISVLSKKQFRLPDGTEHPGPMEAIVLDFAYGNNFYKKPYKEGQKEVAPPDCFARGRSLKGMVPSKSVAKPESSACDTCPNNQFGTRGDGKACANNGYLALMMPDAKEDDPIYILKISPTGIKAWDSYVNTIRAKSGLVPIQVVTSISFDPGSAYASLRFAAKEPNKDMETFFPRRVEARGLLELEPEVQKAKALPASSGKKAR